MPERGKRNYLGNWTEIGSAIWAVLRKCFLITRRKEQELRSLWDYILTNPTFSSALREPCPGTLLLTY